ncbi:serine hydrolase domain-containing protein [Maricaulis sp. D1M11]|uniref:serine hydrolase domain-containing protein n=1 Tax=Maricaulis sp. D1M11 TaxID=3076117 RepID=UPI0039B51C46
MKIWTIRVGFGVAALLWCVLSLSAVRSLTTIPSDAGQEEIAATMDAVLTQSVSEYTIAGVAAGVMHGGDWIWSARYGVRDGENRPVLGETAFNLASISKPVMVWIVLSLAQDELIDLDAPIGRYLHQFELDYRGHDPEQVTVRRLLEHTGGTNNHGYGGYGAHEDQPADIHELSTAFQPIAVVREPGVSRVYSGGGYVLLQMMVEEVMDAPLDMVAQQRVFAPLGMTDSAFDRTRPDQLSQAFNYYGKPIESLRDVALAAAGGYSSGDDMERFLRAHIDGGGVLQPDVLAQAFAPLDSASWTGMSYTLSQTPDGVLIGHGGNNSTWHGQIYVRPQTGDGFYFLTNATGGAQLDFDLSCAWLSHVNGVPAGEACAGAVETTRMIGRWAAVSGVLALALGYWLIAGLVTGRRTLVLIPRGRTALRLTGRLTLAGLVLALLSGSLAMFYTNFVYWRTEVIFIDEIPIDELEWLLPAILSVLAMALVALWSSPGARRE